MVNLADTQAQVLRRPVFAWMLMFGTILFVQAAFYVLSVRGLRLSTRRAPVAPVATVAPAAPPPSEIDLA